MLNSHSVRGGGKNQGAASRGRGAFSRYVCSVQEKLSCEKAPRPHLLEFHHCCSSPEQRAATRVWRRSWVGGRLRKGIGGCRFPYSARSVAIRCPQGKNRFKSRSSQYLHHDLLLSISFGTPHAECPASVFRSKASEGSIPMAGVCAQCSKGTACRFRQPGTWVVDCQLFEKRSDERLSRPASERLDADDASGDRSAIRPESNSRNQHAFSASGSR